MELEREIIFYPAWDKRHIDPSKNYGIHGVDMTWYLKGEKGTLQFVVYTNWHLPEIKSDPLYPLGADVGLHSYTPMCEGQSMLTECCSVLQNQPCYYEGTGLLARDYLDLLIREGSDVVWSKLEETYYSWTKAL